MSAFHKRQGHFEADLDRDGSNERFSVCTSYEDIHLKIWTGTPYQGVERWWVSYYVPYDLDPSCPGIPKHPDEDK